ncbi:phosphotransferase enzyme family protein [Rossellomorea aquimaris]|uniref:Ser/Thr protein kinase RdoA (MazF antagonist) n=1 Tax=Rossellomorea aquimaris TaxID=189382 RepID=A0A366ES20_9BACI|nr:phosphotransferase [Rossellomorea aquimaris]RBP04265.1 Ser/Thr protein kinase RdoA (MazF antagonist) [Rossellomorea aquimaris]
MEKWIEELFTEGLFAEAASRYGCNTAHAKKLGDFENYVYEVHKGGTPYILRLTHSSHRTESEVEAELKWVNYLHKHGVNVSLVNHSDKGKLVEVIKAGDTYFYVCLFDKAPGSPLKVNDPLFDEELFYKWGKMTGHMHRVTKGYGQAGIHRLRWDQDDVLDFKKYLSVQDGSIIEKGHKNKEMIRSFVETKDTFGLIHSDIHPGNFFYHEGDLHVFDFDDSTQFFFISDVAIPLYYSVWWKLRNENLDTRSQFGAKFLVSFLKGYLTECDIEEEWVDRIPHFLLLRDLTLYSVFHKKWDLENLSDVEESLLSQIRDRLLHDEPIVDLDYGEIIEKARAK